MIRLMNLEDINAVIEIEKESFADPWSKEDLEKELLDNVFARYFVCEIDEKVIGYIGIWITFDSSQITNIAVKKEYRHLGYGQELLNKAIKEAENEDCEFMTLEVRVSNEKAINLYKKNKFEIATIKKAYYTNNYEDAYYMVKALMVKI